MSCISSECVRRQVAGLHALLPRLISLSDNSTLIPDATMADKWKALLKRVPDLPVGACMQGPHRGMHIVLLVPVLVLVLLVLVLLRAFLPDPPTGPNSSLPTDPIGSPCPISLTERSAAAPHRRLRHMPTAWGVPPP